MVAHRVYLTVCKTRLAFVLTRLDVLALLLAALAHDAGHLGRSNEFEVASESPAALTYNNKSPLENHHTATLFRILQRHGLLVNLPRSQRTYVRQLVIDMISATNMDQHGDVCSRLAALAPRLARATSPRAVSLDELAAGGEDGSGAAGACCGAEGKRRPEGETAEAAELGISPAERTLLLQSTLHACDLSTPTLPWEASRRWVLALANEFNAQAQARLARRSPSPAKNPAAA